MIMRYFIALFFLIVLSYTSVSAQTTPIQKEPTKPLTRILFLFDASQSMYGRWQSDMKITIARRILSDLLDSLQYTPDLEVALRVYGHQKDYPPQDCDDSKLEVPFGPNNFSRIKHRLSTINPKGTTPIALSLERSAGDFPPCENCRNIIVLITDGIEECDGDPCAVSLALQKKGIILKPFIIGIGKNFAEQFDCVGTYFDATTETEFRKALEIVISQALNSTSCQVNLLDIAGNPTETNVNMTFYDQLSGLPKYNFIHTMNAKGFPDTLIVDPMLEYRIQIHTIPPVFIDSLKLTPGKHTIVGTDAPQGFLELKVMGKLNPNNKPLTCIVRSNNQTSTLNIQYFNQREKYIVGLYDLEILTLPRTYVENVKIDQSTTTTVEIPMPGTAVIQFPGAGYGSLYVMKENTLEWIYNFKGTGEQETLLLQPGKYKAVFRAKFFNRSIYTVEKTFSIESNTFVKVNLSML